MSEPLGDLLRRSADAVPVPRLDLDGLVAEAGARQRRRRVVVVAAAAAAVGAIAAGSFLVTRANPSSLEPAPALPPSSSPSGTVAVDRSAARPLVYADGSTVHVGDRTVEARRPVAFIDATDDGAVYEAAYGTALWFTDGTTTSVIGTTAFTAAPTSHGGVVKTGNSGSLVVWADASAGPEQEPTELVVYDTSRRQEVGRIPFPGTGPGVGALYVSEDEVYFNPDSSTPGCWAVDVQVCKHPHLFRFDVASGETTKITLADLDAELGTRARRFDLPAQSDFDPDADPSFVQVGQRLVNTDFDGNPVLLRTTSGEEVRLRLPSGFTVLGQRVGASVVSVSEWLDDDHVVVWANGGGGDLPAREGDLLVCPLPDGTCRVAVQRSSHPYVAP